nr:unnamed protein product [Callosobruchus analis]
MIHKALLACTFLVATANCSNTTLGWGHDGCYDLESEIVLYEPGQIMRRTVHEVHIPPNGGWYRNQILCILVSIQVLSIMIYISLFSIPYWLVIS